VRVFYTAPTLIRALMQHGDEPVKRHDRSSLRVLGTVGEPIGAVLHAFLSILADLETLSCPRARHAWYCARVIFRVSISEGSCRT